LFTKLKDAQKAHNEKAADKMNAHSEKQANKAYEKYKSKVEDLLLPDEELLNIYGLAFEFCFITNERLVFNHAVLSKKKVTSVFLKHIQEISMDSGLLFGEVEVATSRENYKIDLIDKGVCKMFYTDLLLAMRNI